MGEAQPGRCTWVGTVGGRSYRGCMRPISELVRTVAPFEVIADFQPSGDQPQAITELEERIRAGEKDVVLLGATGTGKSATTAWLVERLQRPTLVLAHNKTLAAQLDSEFKDFFPNNAVSYFVSYYDYYQPEAYVPRHDPFIEKDTQINEEINRLRFSTSLSEPARCHHRGFCLLHLRDRDPAGPGATLSELQRGSQYRRNNLLRHLVDIQYDRNDIDFRRGTFRVRGDTLRDLSGLRRDGYRIEFWGTWSSAIADCIR